MHRFLLLSVTLGALSIYGCTGELSVGPWLGEDGAGERGPGSGPSGGGEGASGPGSSSSATGGAGGGMVMDCTNDAIKFELEAAVKKALAKAQFCDPSTDKIKCDLFVEGMCCDEVVDKGDMDKNIPNIDAYLAALQKWKDAGCKCTDQVPDCPPHGPVGICDPTNPEVENEGICKKN